MMGSALSWRLCRRALLRAHDGVEGVRAGDQRVQAGLHCVSEADNGPPASSSWSDICCRRRSDVGCSEDEGWTVASGGDARWHDALEPGGGLKLASTSRRGQSSGKLLQRKVSVCCCRLLESPLLHSESDRAPADRIKRCRRGVCSQYRTLHRVGSGSGSSHVPPVPAACLDWAVGHESLPYAVAIAAACSSLVARAAAARRRPGVGRGGQQRGDGRAAAAATLPRTQTRPTQLNIDLTSSCSHHTSRPRHERATPTQTQTQAARRRRPRRLR